MSVKSVFGKKENFVESYIIKIFKKAEFYK